MNVHLLFLDGHFRPACSECQAQVQHYVWGCADTNRGNITSCSQGIHGPFSNSCCAFLHSSGQRDAPGKQKAPLLSLLSSNLYEDL